MEQELLTLREHSNSRPVFNGFVLLTLFFSHCMNLTLHSLERNKDLLTGKGLLVICLSIRLIMIVPDEGDSMQGCNQK
jgi:hypothetical protein